MSHRAIQHPPIELTSGMRPGSNSFTLIVKNWQYYSMSYGWTNNAPGGVLWQSPYIVQVNSA